MITERFSVRERLLAAWTAGLLAAAPIFKLGAEPLLARWASLRDRTEAASHRLDKGRRLLDQEARIRAAYERWAVAARQKGSDQEAMGRFLKEVEGLARRGPLRITDLRPLPVQDSGSHKRFAVELESRDTPAALTRFLYGVEVASPLLRVERLSLMSSKGEVSVQCLIAKIMLPEKGPSRPEPRPPRGARAP